jgi:hypothetical protein
VARGLFSSAEDIARFFPQSAAKALSVIVIRINPCAADQQ